MTTTTKLEKPARFTRSIVGGYRQDVNGDVWTWNDQRGWVRVNADGRAFLECLTTQTKASLLLRRAARAAEFIPNPAVRLVRRELGIYVGTIFDAEGTIARFTRC